jgi:hypothetical protein
VRCFQYLQLFIEPLQHLAQALTHQGVIIHY